MIQIKNTSSQTLVMIFLMKIMILVIYVILQKTKYSVEINKQDKVLKYKNKVILELDVENYNIYKFVLASKTSFILRIIKPK